MEKLKQFDIFIVTPQQTAFTALSKIELNGFGTVIVVNEKSGCVIGTVSDGDIRKVLLDHHMLTIPVQQVMNQHPSILRQVDVSKADNLFSKSFYIRLIPIVNSQGVLVDIIKRT